jgi:biopolymer transport protein ExbB/TolQ
MAIFEIVFILALIALQGFIFYNVWRKIGNFKDFFPDKKKIKIRQIDVGTIGEPETLDLLEAPKENEQFKTIIDSTNDYLRKNKGAAADFSILKDISERHLEKFDNEIGNLINVPLYIGLGGTFVGIIIGLWGIFPDDQNTVAISMISMDSISQLLDGVVAAMFASLFGLVFTVVNSWKYRSAAYQNDSDRNSYYDFLQRELLPSLNTGVARSLGNLNIVLNEFLLKFGENMDDYRDSGRLLNDNLAKQQFVLEEINKLSLTRAAATIANTFAQLNESSEHLRNFLSYQKGLNEYIDKSENVTAEMKSIIDTFKDFNNNLKAIGNKTLDSLELQKQFKDSLETHFPTISDHRAIWRSQIDELTQDVKKVYQELYNYFKEQTEQVKTYVENNNGLLGGIEDIKTAVQIFVENSKAQKSEFELLQKEMTGLRNDFKESQRDYNKTMISMLTTLKEIKQDASKETIETSEALTKAIKSLNTTIWKLAKQDKSDKKED